MSEQELEQEEVILTESSEQETIADNSDPSAADPDSELSSIESSSVDLSSEGLSSEQTAEEFSLEQKAIDEPTITDSENDQPDNGSSENAESDNSSSEKAESDNTPSENAESDTTPSENAEGSASSAVINPSAQPVQEEMAFALINGEPVKEMPKDLYIPPDALEVFLEAFEGPLDLLLYLIRRQNLDIVNIPIAHITEQYMEYVEIMKSMNLELAAEYLVMASVLCEIKSRVLLPRPKTEDEEEIDPRADLIRRLQEYERFKKAAEDIDEIPRTGRDVYVTDVEPPELHLVRPQPEVDLKEILLAFADVLKRADMFTHHQIQRETLSVREKMTNVLAILSTESFTDFITLFTVEEGRMGVVVTFLSIMELSKEKLIELVQAEPYGPIHVRARGQVETDELLA